MDEGRFHRQMLLFGAEGQKRIEATHVAIVGLGGTGSHVAQQLAYLGVRAFALIDKDTVSKSNLNRLIGAREDDVKAKRHKVEIAAAMIRAITPDADLEIVPKSFITAEGFAALRSADFVFGCMDRDGARLILTEFCAAFLKPYLDIATDIHIGDAPSGKDVDFGGRTVLSRPGRQCLWCLGALDMAAVRRDLATDAQLEEEERIYGVLRKALKDKGPSVVSLNGILTSLAVTEFMVEITGIRPAVGQLEYKGKTGKVVLDTTAPEPDCVYCKGSVGAGDKADMMRYVRQGLGERL